MIGNCDSLESPNSLPLIQRKFNHFINRLTNIVSSTNSTAVSYFRYVYNDANQRTSVTNVDGSYWVYQYDALGQVTSGRKFWSDGTPVAGQQFTYGFDDIGNRKTSASGGNNSGTDLQFSSYTANLLNQYSSRTVPAVVGVSGTATNTATVTVNFEATQRKGDYWWGEAPAANAWGPLWLGITNIAVLDDSPDPDIIATNFGHVYVPQSPEAFTYDDDGNLTSDGRWSYTWDGENRAMSFTRVASAPDDAKVKLDCQYDAQWRRIEKVVSAWTGSTYAPELTNRFVYDGWNLMAIVDETSAVMQSFTWGSDASGSMQGAGGVGGLISMTVHSGANAGTYFYCYDGNHNVRALVDASDGAVVAEYDYSPFGQLIRATGPLALENPFLFSTKFCDWETGLYYYGYRYYDADTGSWPNRDPIQEKGGVNLYGFVGNNSIGAIDYLGKFEVTHIGQGARWCSDSEAFWSGMSFGFDGEDARSLSQGGVLLIRRCASWTITPCRSGGARSGRVCGYYINRFTLDAAGNVTRADSLYPMTDGSSRLPFQWAWFDNMLGVYNQSEIEGDSEREKRAVDWRSSGSVEISLEYRLIPEPVDSIPAQPPWDGGGILPPIVTRPEVEHLPHTQYEPSAWNLHAYKEGTYSLSFSWDRCCRNDYKLAVSPLLPGGPNRFGRGGSNPGCELIKLE